MLYFLPNWLKNLKFISKLVETHFLMLHLQQELKKVCVGDLAIFMEIFGDFFTEKLKLKIF